MVFTDLQYFSFEEFGVVYKGSYLNVKSSLPDSCSLKTSLLVLVKESKMSMMVRKQIDESLRNGEPLPLPEPPRPNTKNDVDRETLAILDSQVYQNASINQACTYPHIYTHTIPTYIYFQ